MDNELKHHGILGMHWGIRRFQNSDGTYTEEGKKRRGSSTHTSSSGTKHGGSGGKFGDSSEKEASAARKKEIAKKVAIGVGITAAVAIGVAVVASSANAKVSDLDGSFASDGKDFADNWGPQIVRVSDGKVFNPSDSDYPDLSKETASARMIREAKEENRRMANEAAEKLEHHGIDGMHWGVRNGPPYPLTKKYKQAAIKDRVSGYEKSMLSKSERLDFTGRAQEAAKLGIKALIRMGTSDLGSLDINNKDTQWWFLTEDQTIGFPECADLINQGYSAKEAKQIVSDCFDAYKGKNDTREYLNSPVENIYAGVRVYSGNGHSKGAEYYDTFIDACADIKSDEKNRGK